MLARTITLSVAATFLLSAAACNQQPPLPGAVELQARAVGGDVSARNLAGPGSQVKVMAMWHDFPDLPANASPQDSESYWYVTDVSVVAQEGNRFTLEFAPPPSLFSIEAGGDGERSYTDWSNVADLIITDSMLPAGFVLRTDLYDATHSATNEYQIRYFDSSGYHLYRGELEPYELNTWSLGTVPYYAYYHDEIPLGSEIELNMSAY